MFGLSILASLADLVEWAQGKCAEYGVEPTPANVAFVAAVYNTPPAPVVGSPVDADTWSARQHDVKTSRTTKGATTSKVTKRGSAFVVGSHDIPVLLEMSGRKLRGGWSTLAVQRATDRLYPQLPKLLGTDVMAWQQVVHTDRSDAASGKAGESGDTRITWPARMSLRKPAKRASDPIETPSHLIAAHDDPERIWHGHRLVVRKPARSHYVKRAARTIGAYRTDTIGHALDALRTIDLAKGQRVTFTGVDWNLMVTRGMRATKPINATVRRDGAETITLRNSTSPAAIADRIARTVTT